MVPDRGALERRWPTDDSMIPEWARAQLAGPFRCVHCRGAFAKYRTAAGDGLDGPRPGRLVRSPTPAAPVVTQVY